MATKALTTSNMDATSLEAAVEAEKAKREIMVRYAESTLVEKVDYHVIQGKKSLGKPGAEKICALYGVTIGEPELHAPTMESLPEQARNAGAFVYLVKLYRGDIYIGSGIGARRLSQDNGDLNKSIKMAKKSAIIDAVISTFGLSDLFTLDLEDMNPEDIGKPSAVQRQADRFEEKKPLPNGDHTIFVQSIKNGVSATGKAWEAISTSDGDRLWNNSGQELHEGATYDVVVRNGGIVEVKQDSLPLDDDYGDISLNEEE